MATYLKHEKKVLQQKIKDYYDKNKDEISETMFRTPLREFTYEENMLLYNKEDLDAVQTAKGLAVYLDNYIHRFNVRLNKDATLEEAVKKVI